MIVNEKKNIKIFTNNIDYSTLEQIYQLENTGMFSGQPIRIMPDCHSGMGCVIGFTAPLTDKLCPNIVGADLNCGMLCVELGKVDIDLVEFDEIVKEVLSRKANNSNNREEELKSLVEKLCCKNEIKDIYDIEKSFGTLGGGNHFLELDRDEDDNIYLIIHTGSRLFGKQVAKIYQKKAEEYCQQKRLNNQNTKLNNNSASKEKSFSIPKDMSYLEGKELTNYLHDIKICKDFADKNRQIIASSILSLLNIIQINQFTVLHNYIGDDGIIRKGAISAKQGEIALIPLNMRDGCIIGYGKGNEDWNNSAPHGAGRVMSRSQAKKELDVELFQKSMEGIYSSTISESTIDESPFAYKPSEEIIGYVKDTIDIKCIIKPIYNYKEVE